jgi:tetratricopeptide (TPR) repeat protein
LTNCNHPDDHSRHDFLILSSPNDIPHWSSLADHKKIKTFGYPRYDSWWIKHLIETEEFQQSQEYQTAKKHKPVFFYISRGPHPHYLSIDNYQYLLSSFMETALAYPDSLIIIKPHPRQNLEELNRLLAPYDQDRWIISGLHLMQLTALADVVISGWSSGILDALALEKPVIELWRFDGRDPSCRRNKDGVCTSIYRELGLAAPADTAAELDILMQEALSAPNNKRWQAQRLSFTRHCRQTADACGALANFLLQETESRRPSGKVKSTVAAKGGIVRTMLHHVEKMAENEDITGSKRWLEFMLKEFPADPRVHNSLGVVLFNSGDFLPAVDHLVESLNLNEDYLEAAVNLTQILISLERDTDADELAATFFERQDEENRRKFQRELENCLTNDQISRIKQKAFSLTGD